MLAYHIQSSLWNTIKFTHSDITDAITTKVAWGQAYDTTNDYGFYETPTNANNAFLSINSVTFSFKMPTIDLTNVNVLFTFTDNDSTAGPPTPPPTFIYHSTISTTFPGATCLGTATNAIKCTNIPSLTKNSIYDLSFKFVIAPDATNTNY
jgi:hypothetical protein